MNYIVNERKEMNNLDKNWKVFFIPYVQAMEELKVKLRGIRKQFEQEKEHAPIEFVTGRIKPLDSIKDKQKRKNLTDDEIEQLEDIVGLRIMCQFVEDIYDVVKILRQREDMQIVEERDYVTHQKVSGYRSFHLICKYPVQMKDGQKNILIEIQIRTLAMNFWATIEHSLNYKYQGEYPPEINNRLIKAAESAFQLDEEMSQIRSEIKDAQRFYSYRNYDNI